MTTGKSATIPLSIMMFLQFFVWGAWYVSQTGFMAAQGMGDLIAWAYTVGPIAAIVSPFFLGMVADRFFASQKVLGVLHIIGALAMGLAPALARPYTPDTGGPKFLEPYVLCLLVHMLCYMPTLALTTSLSMHHMANPERQFPVVRVWGTFGWIVGNIVVGGNLYTWNIDLAWIADGDKSAAQFYVTSIAGVMLGIFSFMLPHTPPPLAGRRTTVREVLGLDALSLLAKPSYAVFILCSFLLCIPLAGYYGFARSYVDASGFANATLTMTSGQLSEIFFMIVMPLCFARLGVKWMLAVGMLAWVARYGLFSAAADGSVKWMILTGVILHGICYDFFFVTGMVYSERSAPPTIRGQAQGFLVLVTQGLGMLIGAQAFGRLVDAYTTRATAPDGSQIARTDWMHVWLWPCLFAAAIFFIFVVAFRVRRTPPAPPAPPA